MHKLPDITTLIDNLPGAVYSCRNDPEWTMEYLSDMIMEITGYPASDFIDNAVRSYGSIIHEDDRDYVWKEIQQAVAEKKSYTLEYRILSSEGETKVVWERGRARYKDDEPAGLDGFIEDITARRKAEDALRESEEKFRFIADNAVDIIWQVDKSLRFTYLSPSLFDITGFKPEEWIGTRIMSHTTWFEFLRQSRQAMKLILNYRNFSWLTLETKVYNKEGELIPAEIVGKPLIIDGRLKGLQGAARDIRNRTEAEERLRQSQSKFLNFVEYLPVPLCSYDMDNGDILYMNDKFTTVFGYTKEDIPHLQDWWIKAYPDNTNRKEIIARWNAAMKKAERSGSEIQPDEYTVSCSDGSKKIVMIGGLMLEKEFLATFQDITDQKEVEIELRELRDSLQKQVDDQTKELKERITELEKFHNATIEREFRIRELKDEIERLKRGDK
ncbi:MAG: PAS domain S-box protein [Bacteroidales bacterium]